MLDFIEPIEIDDSVITFSQATDLLNYFQDLYGFSMDPLGVGTFNEKHLERMSTYQTGFFMDCVREEDGFRCFGTGNPTADQMLFKANIDKLFADMWMVAADIKLKIAHAFTDRGIDSTGLNVLSLYTDYKNSGAPNNVNSFADWVLTQQAG